MLVIHVINGTIYLCDLAIDETGKMHQVTLDEAIEMLRQIRVETKQ